jgi:hypothetical protein
LTRPDGLCYKGRNILQDSKQGGGPEYLMTPVSGAELHSLGFQRYRSFSCLTINRKGIWDTPLYCHFSVSLASTPDFLRLAGSYYLGKYNNNI